MSSFVGNPKAPVIYHYHKSYRTNLSTYAGYFVHSVTRECSDKSNGTTWANAPKCLLAAQDLMIHRGRTYGEAPTFSINELNILAWVTLGGGKVVNIQSQ